MTTNLTLTALAAIAALGFVSTAQAADDGSTTSVRVSYRDLDLSSPAGAKAMIGRITHASKAICGAEPGINDLIFHEVFGRCVKQTVDTAIASLDKPMVTAMYTGHTTSQVAFNGR